MRAALVPRLCRERDSHFRTLRHWLRPPIGRRSASGTASSHSLARLAWLKRLSRLPRTPASDAERVDPSRYPGIDRLQENFADLVLGYAVLERAFDMHFQFVRPVQATDHRE